MKRLCPFFVLMLAFIWGGAIAQTSLDPQSIVTAKNTKGIYSPKQAKAVKRKKTNVKHTAQYEFYERVEKAAKEKQRILKQLSRPQYSNPAYFGHKKKPKKRPPHRMRYCSECHIRH